MPLTAGGKLRIVASADLGGLGPKDGAPTEYTWMLPGLAPLLVPWLMILALLMVKSNRCLSAWLLWLPLGCVAVVTSLGSNWLPNSDFLLDSILALVFGLAAVWLLSNYLRRSHRVLTFFCVMLVLAVFSALAYVGRQGLEWTGVEIVQVGAVLGLGVLISTLAISLAGWICRGRYRPLALYLWLVLLLAALWLVLCLPFFLFASFSSGGQIQWIEFIPPVLLVSGVNFALLLPFLILSSANAFFRERLKALLNVRLEAPPILPAVEAKP